MLDSLAQGSWFAVLEIVVLNILLSGDNAVVIALACRQLPPAQRRQGIVWGVVGAVVLRVALVSFALQLLALPFLRLAGAAVLLWIGVRLLQPDGATNHAVVMAADHRWGAVRTIVVADAVMSLDNVLAIAGAFRGDFVLVVLGVAASIPIIVWGSGLVLALMQRFPWVVTAGGALLGWIAGNMALADAALEPYASEAPAWLVRLCALASALSVVGLGTWLARRGAAPG